MRVEKWTMKIVSLLAGLMLLATLTFAPTAMAQGTNFLAVLNGANQIPSIPTNGHGVFLASLSADGGSLSFRLNVANIENVMVAHIHLGDSTHNGPPVAFLLHATLLRAGVTVRLPWARSPELTLWDRCRANRCPLWSMLSSTGTPT